MLSEFDRENIRAIIRFDKPQYDWFGAFLLRAIFRATDHMAAFAAGFPDECKAAQMLLIQPNDWNAPKPFTEEEFMWALYYLFGKADAGNQLRLFKCFPKLALRWGEWIVAGCTEKEFKEYWDNVNPSKSESVNNYDNRPITIAEKSD